MGGVIFLHRLLDFDLFLKKMSFFVNGRLVVHSFPALSLRCLARNASGTTTTALKQVLREELDGIRAAGTWKTERVITTPQAATIRVQGQTSNILNFCANNYLGLSVRNFCGLMILI